MENFQLKKVDIFGKNIDYGYTLEQPHRGGSNEYPQSMFWSKNKKKGIPLHSPVLPKFIKVGFKGVYNMVCLISIRFLE